MPFSKCRDVIERVNDIVDGAAGPVARARFKAHMMMCDQCAAYYQQMVAIQDTLGQVAPEDLAPDFEQVMGAVLAEIDSADQKKL